MDFPSFFQRPSHFAEVTARWFRGLTVLCQDPLRRDQETISPVTGEQFADNDNAIHVIYKPLIIAGAVPASGGVNVLAAKPGKRYLIKSALLTYRLIAADTTATIYGTATINGTASTVFIQAEVVPLVASASSLSVNCNILTDPNTAVIANCNANPTAGLLLIYYAEVGTA